MIQTLARNICDAAGKDDLTALDSACSVVIRHMEEDPAILDKNIAEEVLKCLRKNRRFGQVRRMANAFLDEGCSSPLIRYNLGHAMIETGEPMPAVHTLAEGIGVTVKGDKIWGEFKGALGRAWKDRAMKTRGRRDDLAKEAIRESVRHYREAWLENKQAFTYQGVNFVAIAHWDAGLALDAGLRAEATEAAQEIVDIIASRPEAERDSWACATAGEASLALGNVNDAIAWYHKYVRDVGDPFDLASSARQLQVLWKADQNNETLRILAPLIGKLGITAGGIFSISPAALENLAAIPKDRHEAVLGTIGTKTYYWVQKGITSARSVVMIRKNGSAHGTGFVVRGGDFREDLGDELLIMTNSHVVSDPPEPDAASKAQATVTFELANGPHVGHKVKEIIWQSNSSAHDVALLRITPVVPNGIEHLSFTHELPLWANRGSARVHVIGHPGGRELSFSFEDCQLLDYEHAIYNNQSSTTPCRIHYRSPTEEGSSGSPVFDENWNVIGIHHAGGKLAPMLNGERGVYAANEGLWIETIRRAIAEKK